MLGKAINGALDRADDKITADERRKRWQLSLRIEQAMQDRVPLAMAAEDEARIKAAADLITQNHVMARIHEAVFDAKVLEKVKANGKGAEAPQAEAGAQRN